MLLHATTVVIEDRAIVLTGPSGVGKSDLALRLIDEGAVLLADDQTEFFIAADGRLTARAPQTIMGLIEVRHVGLIRLPFVAEAPVALHVQLSDMQSELTRLPEIEATVWLGQSVPLLRLPARAASTPAKIRFWLRHGVAKS